MRRQSKRMRRQSKRSHNKTQTKKQTGGFRYGNVREGDVLISASAEPKTRTKSRSRSKSNKRKGLRVLL